MWRASNATWIMVSWILCDVYCMWRTLNVTCILYDGHLMWLTLNAVGRWLIKLCNCVLSVHMLEYKRDFWQGYSSNNIIIIWHFPLEMLAPRIRRNWKLWFRTNFFDKTVDSKHIHLDLHIKIWKSWVTVFRFAGHWKSGILGLLV